MYLPARYNIDIHDYSVRLKAAKKFLKAGDKVMRMLFVQARDCVFCSITYCLRLPFSG
jgi:translation initiation factor IF-3